MKAITTKEYVSLVVIVIIAPLFALALIAGVRATVAAGHELLLLALTLCGAVVSGINGFGRRTARVTSTRTEAAEGHIQTWPLAHESSGATFAGFLSTQGGSGRDTRQ
jgi:hypothetical protein